MPNSYGQFYGYTGLFPVIEEAQSESHTDQLRAILAAMPNGAGSMFSRTGLVHGARMFVIDDVIYNGAPSQEEHLAYSYLAVSITFDGDLERLAERISAVGLDEFNQVFSHCYGHRDSASVLAYLRACQVDTTFLYVDLKNVGLPVTLRALCAQRLIADLVERGQGLDTAARKRLVREVAALISDLKPPEPGFLTGPLSNSSAIHET